MNSQRTGRARHDDSAESILVEINGRSGDDDVLTRLCDRERPAKHFVAHAVKLHGKTWVVAIERPTIPIGASDGKHRNFVACPRVFVAEVESRRESHDDFDGLPDAGLIRRQREARHRKALRAGRPGRDEEREGSERHAERKSPTKGTHASGHLNGRRKHTHDARSQHGQSQHPSRPEETAHGKGRSERCENRRCTSAPLSPGATYTRRRAMNLRVSNITFDCDDVMRVATFWSTALGRPLDTRSNEFFASIGGKDGERTQPAWYFAKVPEAKQVKNRMHLDLITPDYPEAIDELVALGATQVDMHEVPGGSHGWTIMRDPEGNEFCVAAKAFTGWD
jgi:hypothetical protein